MGSQQRRFGKRKVLGTAVVAGVLAAAGVAGVQFSYAGESADGVVVINGQEFDAEQVAECAVIQINGAQVLCDDVELEAVELADAAQLQLIVDALEANCDILVAEVDGQNINNAADVDEILNGVNEEDLAEEEAERLAEEEAEAAAEAEAEAIAAEEAEEAEAAEEEAAEEEAAEEAEEAVEEEVVEENVALADQELDNLINTCLALGRAKAADLDAAAAAEEAEEAEAAEEEAAEEEAAEEAEKAAKE